MTLGMSRASKICWVVLGLLVLGFSYQGLPARASQTLLDSLNSETVRIVQKVKPSLVTVESYYQQSNLASIQSAVATGILYSREGYVITTAAIVRPNRTYRLRDYQGRNHRGRLIGTDYETNLAVMKIEATDMVPAELGDSRKVKAGSWVAVLADGYELPNSVSLGLFNGRRSTDGMMQLSMSLSPVASGGAVVNSQGEVIGILSAKGSEIVSFGPQSWVPVQLGKRLGRRLETSTSKNDASSRSSNLPPSGRYQVSLPVSGVGLSGLRDGDIIVLFNRKPVDGTQVLFTMVRSTKPGSKVNLEVVRGGIAQTVEVELQQIPEAYRRQTVSLNLPGSFLFEPELPAATTLGDELKSENQRLRRQVEYLRQQLLEMQKELKEVKSQLDGDKGF